jgi:hypothetical protein
MSLEQNIRWNTKRFFPAAGMLYHHARSFSDLRFERRCISPPRRTLSDISVFDPLYRCGLSTTPLPCFGSLRIVLQWTLLVFTLRCWVTIWWFTTTHLIWVYISKEPGLGAYLLPVRWRASTSFTRGIRFTWELSKHIKFHGLAILIFRCQKSVVQTRSSSIISPCVQGSVWLLVYFSFWLTHCQPQVTLKVKIKPGDWRVFSLYDYISIY